MEYQPMSHQVFWCSKCDNQKVDSEKPETGIFFTVFGHSWSQRSKEYDGAYVGVMYALCPACK